MAVVRSSEEPEKGSMNGVLPAMSGHQELALDRRSAYGETLLSDAGHWVYAVVVKRLIDVVVASLALLLLSPLLVLVAVAIRIDSPGPVLFRQTRVGWHNREFTILKFRTMFDAGHESFLLFKDKDGQWRHKVRDDPRITRVGRLLRRMSIDELPQLVNVVLGDMSLVGPRPELPQIVRRYEPWQNLRHLVRPGLTGWWQVSGRSDRPMHEHTDLDLYYVRHLSIWLDLKILFRTVVVVVRGIGAF